MLSTTSSWSNGNKLEGTIGGTKQICLSVAIRGEEKSHNDYAKKIVLNASDWIKKIQKPPQATILLRGATWDVKNNFPVIFIDIMYPENKSLSLQEELHIKTQIDSEIEIMFDRFNSLTPNVSFFRVKDDDDMYSSEYYNSIEPYIHK